jgi:hypothetical protein
MVEGGGARLYLRMDASEYMTRPPTPDTLADHALALRCTFGPGVFRCARDFHSVMLRGRANRCGGPWNTVKG